MVWLHAQRLLILLFLLQESVLYFAHLLHNLLVEGRLLLELALEEGYAPF